MLKRAVESCSCRQVCGSTHTIVARAAVPRLSKPRFLKGFNPTVATSCHPLGPDAAGRCAALTSFRVRTQCRIDPWLTGGDPGAARPGVAPRWPQTPIPL